jgi:type VI secretion system protein ImpK
MGGEVFFQHLRQLLARQDSEDQADLLEVFTLCLLLGFRGRYGTSEQAELRSLTAAAEEKMRRVRGGFGELTPGWAPPTGEVVPRARDPWLPWLAMGAVTAALLAGILFGVFRSSLGATADELRRTASVTAR